MRRRPDAAKAEAEDAQPSRAAPEAEAVSEAFYRRGADARQQCYISAAYAAEASRVAMVCSHSAYTMFEPLRYAHSALSARRTMSLIACSELLCAP